MDDIKEKGNTGAKIVGVLIVLYSFALLIVSIMALKSITLTSVLILVLSFIGIFIGIGLIFLNYYAWLSAIILSSLIVVSGCINIILHFVNNPGVAIPDYAVKMFWQVIFFALLYSSRHACRENKDQKIKILDSLKLHIHVFGATAITVATLIIITAKVGGGFLILGFPILIIEGALIYLLGQKIQKKLGWDTIKSSVNSDN